MNHPHLSNTHPKDTPATIRLFLCGDVATGRGIDQILRYPVSPVIYESYVRDARDYIRIAEEVNGPIPHPVNNFYIWGDGLKELRRFSPDIKIINLETAVTSSEECWPDKEINYRMNPRNIGSLTAVGIDYCSLANNHVLDWGYTGLKETLATLRKSDIHYAGAGVNLDEAEKPAIVSVKGKGKVIIYSCGTLYSGVPEEWAATANRAGVNLLPDLTEKVFQRIKEKIESVRKNGDIVVFSIHWGANWGYETPESYVRFAHRLIDGAGVDIVHGHSSHHAKGLEVYKGKLILYGCGDLLNDYEGIGGEEAYRPDLALMYFVEIDPSTGKLVNLTMSPMPIRKFRLNKASRTDAQWLAKMLNRESQLSGGKIVLDPNNRLCLVWEK
ncbi:CapA family protein [Parabacteroides sp. FAFU027]|uniref:CapA family protein n=1 Tax=Parabacteroides sp. FAFU027 TaxID=2922715 RepID=UPI001FAEA8A0|nr:CapA family protein [Parabacteroides sp. FAFU027]